MKKNLLHSLLSLLLVLGLTGPARAATPPPTNGPSLTEALNPDGTLRPGAAGSFDARQFRMSTASDGRPVFRPAGTKGAGDERWQDGFGVPNGTDGLISAAVRSGTDTYIGGNFRSVGNVGANGIAKWNGTAWSNLGTGVGNGVNGQVYAVAVTGNGDVYAGGSFTQAGAGVPVSNVAKWNGIAWSPLGTGTDGSVHALAVASNGDVYAGGSFTQAGGVVANGVAKWNGTAWSALGTGLTSGSSAGFVYALAVASNGDVYAGGSFTQAGGVLANRVARWNGTAWSGLVAGTANGMNSAVFALAVAGNGDVYAGGTFTLAGGVVANGVAKWNGTAWSALGTGTANGVNNGIRALAVAGNGDVYAGGNFTQAGGISVNYIAKWNGTAWSALGTGAANGTSSAVNALAVAGNGDTYAGGSFMAAGEAPANYVAKWNGLAWSSLGAGGANGANDNVYALAVASNGDVYVGGLFTQVGGVVANYVAKWNGTAWSSLGTGAANGMSFVVNALAVASNGDVYAGGSFTQAGGVLANRVARWNGTAWSGLVAGTANGMNSAVFALAVAGNGDVYAGGTFTLAGGVVANRVAKWNGTAWSALGAGTANGLGNNVRALAVAGNGDVYAAGGFTAAGGVSANGVAKWNGTAWSSLGTGLTYGSSAGFVYALAVAGNGDVYAGGDFTQAGGIPANYMAKWNGTAWSALGTNNIVFALTVTSSGDLYAGGAFTQAGGTIAKCIAKWNGTSWSSLGTGVNTQVNYLAIGTTGKLYASGTFTTTGDGSKAMSHFAIYDPNAPLATAASQKAAPAALFPNPAHGTATLRLPAGAPRQPLTLTDALGRTVRRYPAPATAEAELDLRGLPAGVYVVRCGEISQRVVVE